MVWSIVFARSGLTRLHFLSATAVPAWMASSARLLRVSSASAISDGFDELAMQPSFGTSRLLTSQTYALVCAITNMYLLSETTEPLAWKSAFYAFLAEKH